MEEANGGQDIEEFYRTKLKFGVATSGISTLDMFNQYFRQVIVILVGFVLVRQEAIGADIFIAFYWQISHPKSDLPGGEATLFLAGANHGCCEKAK